MTQEEAINVLIQVAELAQSKGVLTLKDAVHTARAISVFTEVAEQPKTEEPKAVKPKPAN